MTLAASEDEAIFAGGPPSSPPAKNLFFVAVLLRPRQRKSIGIVFSSIKNPPTPPTETAPLHLSLSQRATCLALVYAIEPLRLSYLHAAPPLSFSAAHLHYTPSSASPPSAPHAPPLSPSASPSSSPPSGRDPSSPSHLLFRPRW